VRRPPPTPARRASDRIALRHLGFVLLIVEKTLPRGAASVNIALLYHESRSVEAPDAGMRSPAQVARIATHGRVRRVQSGDVLLDVTDRLARFFVVVSGEVEVVRVSGDAEERVATHRADDSPGSRGGSLRVGRQ
jgi:CRP-like cAMP-binding protein